MSDYFTSLDPVARKRYVERLNLLGLDQSGDPYADSNSGKFANDMTKWPPVEFGHVFFYFIERPGLYTRRQLKQWKSLDAYKYFQSGHVRPILVWSFQQCGWNQIFSIKVCIISIILCYSKFYCSMSQQ